MNKLEKKSRCPMFLGFERRVGVAVYFEKMLIVGGNRF